MGMEEEAERGIFERWAVCVWKLCLPVTRGYAVSGGRCGRAEKGEEGTLEEG